MKAFQLWGAAFSLIQSCVQPLTCSLIHNTDHSVESRPFSERMNEQSAVQSKDWKSEHRIRAGIRAQSRKGRGSSDSVLNVNRLPGGYGHEPCSAGRMGGLEAKRGDW